MREFKQRASNPYFILAFAALVYQILQKSGIEIDATLYRDAVDILSYAFIGTGIYKTFNVKVPADEEKKE